MMSRGVSCCLALLAVLAVMSLRVSADQKTFEMKVKETLATRPTYIDSSVLKLLPKKLFKSVVTGRAEEVEPQPVVVADTLVDESIDPSPSPRVSALEVEDRVKLNEKQKEALDRTVVQEATKRAREKIERDQLEMKKEMLQRIEQETKQRSLLQEAEKIKSRTAAAALAAMEKPRVDYRRLGEDRDETNMNAEERERARLEELTALVPRPKFEEEDEDRAVGGVDGGEDDEAKEAARIREVAHDKFSVLEESAQAENRVQQRVQHRRQMPSIPMGSLVASAAAAVSADQLYDQVANAYDDDVVPTTPAQKVLEHSRFAQQFPQPMAAGGAGMGFGGMPPMAAALPPMGMGMGMGMGGMGAMGMGPDMDTFDEALSATPTMMMSRRPMAPMAMEQSAMAPRERGGRPSHFVGLGSLPDAVRQARMERMQRRKALNGRDRRPIPEDPRAGPEPAEQEGAPSLMEESAQTGVDIRVSERPNRLLRRSPYARQQAAQAEFDDVLEDESPRVPAVASAHQAMGLSDPESDQEEAAMEAASGKIRELSLLENEEVRHINVEEGSPLKRVEPHHVSHREPGVPPPPPFEEGPPLDHKRVNPEDSFVQHYESPVAH